MNPTLSVLVFSAVLLGAGCPGGDGSPTTPVTSSANSSSKVPNGIWGGDHLRMDVTSEGAKLVFDCASATIDGPLITNTDGKLDVGGTFTPEHGGPVREGEVIPSVPARFTGTLKEETLTLSIQITTANGPQDVGTFELKLGSEGRVFRCL